MIKLDNFSVTFILPGDTIQLQFDRQILKVGDAGEKSERH